MKINRVSIAIMAAVMLLSGCSKSEIPDSVQNSMSSNFEISDPMQNSTDNSQGEKIPSTSYGVQFTEENVAISNDKLVVSPILIGDDSSTRVGVMVFIDGILQKYSAENSAEKQYMLIFNIEPKSEVEHRLTVDAEIDGDLDEHIISIISMLAPDYIPPTGSSQFGFYHKILRPYSVKVSKEIESIASISKDKFLKKDNSVLTQNQIDWLDLGEGEGYATGLELLQSDNLFESKYIADTTNEALELKLYSYTTEPVVRDYRITFFVNHEPVKFNGDYDFLDVKLEGEKITVADIELDGVKEGDFIYCIAAPLVEGAHTEKSNSKIIVQQISGETIPGGSNSTASDSQPIANEGGTVQVSGETAPVFSIGDFVYAKKYETSELLKLNSVGEAVKSLANGYDARVHGDKIVVVDYNIYVENENGLTKPSDKPNVTLKLMDMDLNVIKTLEITDKIGGKYDFNENNIVYVYRSENDSEELRLCDWDLKNEKVLMTLPSSESPEARYFDEIVLADGFVAFTAQGEINDKSVEYYGLCDLQGNHKLIRKDGISKEFQVIDNTVLWFDKPVNVVVGEVPSGEIVMYRNGKFEIIKPENPIESQDVFLTGENEFFTALSDGDVLRQYKNGVKTAEIPLEKGEQTISVTRAGNKVFASTMVNGEYKLRIWELS